MRTEFFHSGVVCFEVIYIDKPNAGYFSAFDFILTE